MELPDNKFLPTAFCPIAWQQQAEPGSILLRPSFGYLHKWMRSPLSHFSRLNRSSSLSLSLQEMLQSLNHLCCPALDALHPILKEDIRQHIHTGTSSTHTVQSHFPYWGQIIPSHSITFLTPLFGWHFGSTCGRMVLFPFPTLWTIPEMQSGPANPSKSARIRNVLLRSKGLPKA